MTTHTRREFLERLAAGLAAPSLLMACHSPGGRTQHPAPGGQHPGWDLVPDILARIRPPVFPDREFNIQQYGAVGNGTTDCSAAFRAAIGACAAAGGGRVVVPSGRWLSGAIHLRSNVNLHVARGATIAFDRNPDRFLPFVLTRFEGMELMNYSPLIYALDQQNVAVTGEGTLDGQASLQYWWPWKGPADMETGWRTGQPDQRPARQRLFQQAEDAVPVAQRTGGAGSYLRPSFIQPYRCRNILIEGVTILNSPMWEIHPVLCENVTVRGVTIVSHGPNNDGCDPESCTDVLIEKCTFDTGDDCIAIKSGRNADGRRVNVPSRNIIIRHCEMKDGHGGVTVGSEISGGCWNVFAHDCHMDSPRLDRALRLKNNAMRGGLLEHIYMRDVQIGQVADSVLSIDFYYEEGPKGPFTPIVRDVEIRNVTSKKSKFALYLRGFENAPIRDVRVVDCRFENVERPSVLEHVIGLEQRNVTSTGATR
jgi:polygalacturonase